MKRLARLASLVSLTLLGSLTSDAPSAACVGEHQFSQLHSGTGFSSMVGAHVAMAPGRPPVLAFLGQQGNDPTYALWLHRCLDQACSPGTTSKLDLLDFTYPVTPHVLRRSGDRALVVNSSPFAISLFDCIDAGCNAGLNRTLRQPASPLEVMAAVRSDGRPVVAYVNQVTNTVDLIVCDDANCAQSTHRPISSPYPGFAASEIALALRSDDRPVVAHTNFGEGVPFLDLIVCDSPTCDAPATRPIVAQYGYSLDLAMRSDDRAVIHYATVNNEGTLAVCSDAACTAAPARDLAGVTRGVEMGAGNLPFITAATSGPGYYAYESEDCATQGSFIPLAPTHTVTAPASALGDDGQPFFAWIDSTTNTLHTATCDTAAIRRNGFEAELDASPVMADP
jgi:hypothetical protein